MLLVVGSVNYDLIFRHERLPGPGEGVTRAELVRSCGGKGANQAVVAARCAAVDSLSAVRVSFAGAIGADDFGREQREVLLSDGVDCSHLKEVPGTSTGTSSIWVDTTSGQNRIVNASGANLEFSPSDAESLPYDAAELLIVQNEIPAASIETAIERARSRDIAVIWNPAPMIGADVPSPDPASIDFLTPNENEAAELLGLPEIGQPRDAAASLLDCGYRGVVLTLGEQGVWIQTGSEGELIPAPKVQAVDTTGAGDAFNGAFATALVAGYDARTAARFGVAYASLSVCHEGTQTGFPRQVDSATASLLVR